jgi:uncharacterized protein (DUF58 family)
VFLVTDFFDSGYERTLRVAARKHDVVAISVEDPREKQLPAVGLVAVVDPETGQSGVIDTSSSRVRRRYTELAAEARQRKMEVLRRCGVDLLELSTGEPYEPPFVRFFRERARRVMRAGA